MNWLIKLIILPIRLYQRWISPLLGPRCRYHPSCSEFSIEAFSRYGLAIGLLKSVSRLLRCHPLFPGGHEPVEEGWPRIKSDRLRKSA